MKRYNIPPELQPLSPWSYFGYSILFSIPFIGFICALVLSLSNGNINRRNFARSYFCILIIILVLAGVIISVAIAAGGTLGFLEAIRRRING